MVIDEKFYVGKATDRSVIRMVNAIKRADRASRHRERKSSAGLCGCARRFAARKAQAVVYVVTLPVYGDGILEIYDINELTQKNYAMLGDLVHIVGAARTRLQAMLVVRDIIEDIYNKTGGVAVADFFAGRDGAF